MDKKIKILFVKNITRSFTEKDIDILRKHFDVRVVDFVLSRKNLKATLKTPLNMIMEVIWADVTFSWFADLHAAFAVLFSKVFRKKSIVVAGGYDVANEPSISYGVMRFPKSNAARMAKFALKHADKVLAVSEFNKKEALNYVDSKKIELVYNVVDCDKFKPRGGKDNDLVITVGGVTNNTLKTKGLEIFVKMAEYLPNTKFILVGQAYDNSIEHLKAIAPSNVEFLGHIPNEELPKLYQKAKVYCQLSYRESFGVAVIEAMSCECVPVVTKRAALPEVVGDTGFYVLYGDPEATAEAVKEALKSDKGKIASERVKNMFSIKRRENELKEIIIGLIKERK